MDKNTLIKYFLYLIPDARKRTAYLVKKKVFKEVGDNFVFFPRKIPQDPQFIRFHNNVAVASEVLFVNHDIIHEMFNNLDDRQDGSPEIQKNWDCIEICDNVFLGSRSMIMPGVRLGPNVVVAAGSVVTKDFSGGVVIGGNPARVIGSMDDLVKKREAYSISKPSGQTKEQDADWAWSRWQDQLETKK